MGWYQIHGNLHGVVDELTTSPGGYTCTRACLARLAGGDQRCEPIELWTLWESGRIRLDLLEDRGIEGWWHKPLSESEGPYYYGCPSAWLELSDVGINPEWRDKVREIAAGPGDPYIRQDCPR